jgi:uncharacterized cupin superfamily protein
MPVHEATTEDTGNGHAVTSDGWFVLSLSDAVALRHEKAGAFFPLESHEHRFPDFGINVHVLGPGEPNCLYHAESVQEAFLVLSGECLLVIEEEERQLRAWDFVHCPPGTNHVFVGAGDGPCAILMVGARAPDATVHYPVSEVAGRRDASVTAATDSPPEAYADWPSGFTPERLPWPLA